jgi:hypothetical protein
LTDGKGDAPLSQCMQRGAAQSSTKWTVRSRVRPIHGFRPFSDSSRSHSLVVQRDARKFLRIAQQEERSRNQAHQQANSRQRRQMHKPAEALGGVLHPVEPNFSVTVRIERVNAEPLPIRGVVGRQVKRVAFVRLRRQSA